MKKLKLWKNMWVSTLIIYIIGLLGLFKIKCIFPTFESFLSIAEISLVLSGWMMIFWFSVKLILKVHISFRDSMKKLIKSLIMPYFGLGYIIFLCGNDFSFNGMMKLFFITLVILCIPIFINALIWLKSHVNFKGEINESERKS
ncbi:hypothetical protein [Clostridium sp. HV4-5-A1G]|jgi:hypothetical protein|uniref:hypothetical protein n=1 Tax=Clostridium sp. HV4-5-A1G TaxID=2004595 RepID=UPI00123C7407|nr:hypothetical protein [Clostridium sp. HV4-5-A1G]KAA8667702.1 hypothetical protein F3O63_15480 [Clostridium sp. HV4-5-A1G]